MAAPRPTLGHYRRYSQTHPILITAFYKFRTEGHLESRNERGWVPKPGWDFSGVLNENLPQFYYNALTKLGTLLKRLRGLDLFSRGRLLWRLGTFEMGLHGSGGVAFSYVGIDTFPTMCFIYDLITYKFFIILTADIYIFCSKEFMLLFLIQEVFPFMNLGYLLVILLVIFRLDSKSFTNWLGGCLFRCDSPIGKIGGDCVLLMGVTFFMVGVTLLRNLCMRFMWKRAYWIYCNLKLHTLLFFLFVSSPNFKTLFLWL